MPWRRDVRRPRRRLKPHWLDPRLVEDWSYDEDSTGARRLTCTVGLPDGVRAEVPPPIDNRITIGGVFLVEVEDSLRQNLVSQLPLRSPQRGRR